MKKTVNRRGQAVRQPQLPALAMRKLAIARFAAAMCEDGDNIILGGGAMTLGMTEFLSGKRMRILTNSFQAARRLIAHSENEVFLPGGTVTVAQSVMSGAVDTSASQGYIASKLFIGASAISRLGLMETDLSLAQSNGKWIGQAHDIVVLADSSKFTCDDGFYLCGLEQVSCVVTDGGIAADSLRMLEQAGILVKVVDANTVPDGPVLPLDRQRTALDAPASPLKATRH
nr:DeoR/GlpR family DNA-binding transcription regulator [Massilia sp. JS1662]